jgi:flavin reductase (DIM6/NTAB) family NADH-FMN oxidoreductase RutF
MSSPAETYSLLRYLTSPVVALTSAAQGRQNGMILNSAIRASLIPGVPRVAVFIMKRNLSHDLVFESGAFAFHLLHTDNWDLIWELGFQSGREHEKLAKFEFRIGGSGSPLIEDVYARFDCRVINAMDTGPSTCFLGAVSSVERGVGDSLMTSEYFRDHMPTDWQAIYQANLAAAQEWAARRADEIRPLVWRDMPNGS